MLWVWDFAISLLVALAFGGMLFALMRPGRGEEQGSAGVWLIFVVMLLLLPIWGGGVWLTPIGPALFGVHIWNFVLTGMVLALIVAALMATQTPASPQSNRRLPREQVLARQEMHTWNQFFWILLIVMAASIVLGYWWL
jgi:hypothetical protein